MGSSCKQNSWKLYWKLLETWKLYSGTVVRAVNNYCSQIYDSLWLKSPVGFRHKLDGVMKLANCNMCWKFKRWCKSEYWEPHLVTSSVLFLLLWFLQHWMLWYHAKVGLCINHHQFEKFQIWWRRNQRSLSHHNIKYLTKNKVVVCYHWLQTCVSNWIKLRTYLWNFLNVQFIS